MLKMTITREEGIPVCRMPKGQCSRVQTGRVSRRGVRYLHGKRNPSGTGSGQRKQ